MSLFTCTFLSGYACPIQFRERVWQELRQMHSRAPSVFDFDGTNQIKTDWDVTSLCWTWWRSGREPPFLETGMFSDDGLVAGSWEMFMRIWMTKRVESSVLPSMKLWSTTKWCRFQVDL